MGTLKPATLAPEIDASVLVGFPAAQTYLGFDGHPSTIYVRSATDQVDKVHSVLAATANPDNPSQVSVSRPSDVLVARAKANSAFNGLFLGLGAVALLVGANIMVISVLERRSEVGLRRALGATKAHIRIQFLAEAVLLALLGGAAGVTAGIASTAIYASAKHWTIVIPTLAWSGGLTATILIGAFAGLLPALRGRPHVPHRSPLDHVRDHDHGAVMNGPAVLTARDPVGVPPLITMACRDLLANPRIVHVDTSVGEVPDVSRSQFRFVVPADSGNLRVGHADRPAFPLPHGRDLRVVRRRVDTEGQDLAVEVFGEEFGDLDRQHRLSVVVGQTRDSILKLSRCHCRDEHVPSRVLINPGDNLVVRR